MTRMPDSRTIPALLAEQALRLGPREAVVAGALRLSYARLRDEVLRAARGLCALGVQPGDRVAILMGNRPEWIVAFLAAQQVGATAVCLNTWATPRELEYMLGHAEVKYLVATERFRRNDYRGTLASFADRLPHLRRTVWVHSDPAARVAGDIAWDDLLAGGERVSEQQVRASGEAVRPQDVAALLYTSGSTAAPKAILLQHGGWITNGFHIGERQHVTEQDRLWLAVSLFWSFGCINAMPNLLTHGGCIVLQEHFDAEEALALIERERCTVMYGTPNMVQALAEHPTRAHRNLASLRTGAMIGTPEQISVAVALGAREICNVYGLSETYGNCAVIDAHEPLELRLHSVGRPLPDVTVRIVEAASGRQLPAGEVGEIRVQGPMFSEYYKDEAKTRESFDADGFFCTGDLGMLDDTGHLYYRGRLKEMVKSGGINIAPIEVEETLMRHPSVRTAFVIGVPDPQLDEVLVAIVIPREGAQCDPAELTRFCRQEMAAYKVPARYRIATDAELPLTTTGKVQKMKLHTLLDSATAPQA